jgi:hypothetical protein
LRLWLFPEALKMRYRDIDAWKAILRAPIYNVDEIMNISSH